MASSIAMETPESVEEAGALLGAAITKCNVTSVPSIKPPKGMHSSFAIMSPIPSSELFTRLFQLRSLLRDHKSDKLVAAPSLLAVLMKLLGVSSSLAPQFASDGRVNTPPLWSTPLRKLWVDCVVRCHVLGDSLTGKARIDLFAFVKTMIALAGLNPKSAKAAGGTRMAALMVIGGLFKEIPQKLAPWALDVLYLCHKSMKSSGNGEPSYRLEAARTACSVMIACREAHFQRPGITISTPLVLQGALEDRAITETCKLIKLATSDKFPEVRQTIANLAGICAPMMLHQISAPRSGDSGTVASPTASLEDLISLCLKNIDDEVPAVSVEWSEALARCLTTSIAWGEQVKANTDSVSRRDHEQEDDSNKKDAADSGEALRFSSRKVVSVVVSCSSLPKAVTYLVEHFVKVGGDLVASKCGGPFSSGGRAVRVGVALALSKLLQVEAQFGIIGTDYPIEQVIRDLLAMVGPDLVKQLVKFSGDHLDATSASSIKNPNEKGSSLFGTKTKSHADGGIARMAVSRVLREGLSEMVSESTQLSMLHQLIAFCKLDRAEPLTSHQLQVALVEISNLLSTLGPAAGSCLEDFIPIAKACLSHYDHGVRYETAIACGAMATSFPEAARGIFRSSVDFVQVQHAELVTQATMDSNKDVSTKKTSTKSRRFGKKEEVKEDQSLRFQYAIHGHGLLIAVLLRQLPRLPGGLPSELLSMGLSVGEILVTCQYIEILTLNNPSGACTCVRAGYGIMCGAMTVGGIALEKHISLIFSLWDRSQKQIEEGSKNFSSDHDLICLDALLSSVLAFLEHCSDLLLVLPAALSTTTIILEKLLPLFKPSGRHGSDPVNPAAASRHESAKATLLEAFAWLPPGSYPMIANDVFAFALRHIQAATESDVMCSMLPTLINNEDKILDAKSLTRADRYGQVGGARDIDQNTIFLNAEGTHYGERESVMHFQSGTLHSDVNLKCQRVWGSRILGLFASDENEQAPPTALHQASTWRRPISPSYSTSVRLVDASVQAFASTFGLKNGKEQQGAMRLLEMMIPPFLAQLAKAIGVNTTLAETDRRSKTKDENAAVANITAVLLACLKALPLHEATHNIPIGLGPAWMNKAKDLLLTLLPSTSNIVRRAAAEGLAMLATLGVTEDAHTLQSSVLHSLDEVMQGNKPDGKPRQIPLEPVAAARAGSLLTLACIQRTAHNIMMIHRARSQNRSAISESVVDSQKSSLPTIQMMTRIIPSISCHLAVKDVFVVRTYALHSFALLVGYSAASRDGEWTIEDKFLIKKAVEIIEDNFLSCWTAVSADMDQGQEPEKLSVETSFLAVILRTMTFLVPNLARMERSDLDAGERFTRIALLAIEAHGTHPVILSEAIAFFEILSEHQYVLKPTKRSWQVGTDLHTCMNMVLECMHPNRPGSLLGEKWLTVRGALSSKDTRTAAALCIRFFAISQVIPSGGHDTLAAVFALMEDAAGSRTCGSESLYRSAAAPRQAEKYHAIHQNLDVIAMEVIDTIFATIGKEDKDQQLLSLILLSRIFMVGSTEKRTGSDHGNGRRYEYNSNGAVRYASNNARKSADIVLEWANPCRWQVRCEAGRIASEAILQLQKSAFEDDDFFAGFDLGKAKDVCVQRCKELSRMENGPAPPSFLAFHLSEVLAAACGAIVATIDQHEIRQLQEVGTRFLNALVQCFGGVEDPDEAGVSILEQYSSQILSAAKHAITLPTTDDNSAPMCLFIAGCTTLESILANGLVSDSITFKRMVRPLIPSFKDGKLIKFGTSSQSLQVDPAGKHLGEALIPKVARIGAISRIFILIQNGIILPDIGSFLLTATSSKKCELACQCAAVALDGVRLLKGEGLDLTGGSASGSDEPLVDCEAGLLFGNVKDLDDISKNILVKSWPACLCNALVLFGQVAQDEQSAHSDDCKVWIEKLLVVAMEGLIDARESSSEPSESSPSWSEGLRVDEIIMFCLHGIRASAASTSFDDFDVSSTISLVVEGVLQPSIGKALLAESTEENMPEEMSILGVPHSRNLIQECCKFVEAISAANLSNEVEANLLVSVLMPLDSLDKGDIELTTENAAIIIPSLVNSVGTIIKKGNAPDSLVNAMVHLSVGMMSRSDTIPESLKTSAESMLVLCLSNNSLPTAKQQTIAVEMVKNNQWKAWAVICGQSEVALSGSLEKAQEALCDLDDVSRLKDALDAIRLIMQNPANSAATGLVMNGVGAQVFGLLRGFGTVDIPAKEVLPNRTIVCADCMKIVMAAYQLLVSNELLVPFLAVMFECWIEIIKYNGLPNQATQQSHPDPNLGRMCAQAIVYVARTTPLPFKESMTTLSDHNRTVLEFAVRADMSGYPSAAAQAPQKKKLNLKSFKK